MTTTRTDERESCIPSLSRPDRRRRSVLLGVGDLLWLVGAGMLATLVMHGTHQLGWNFAEFCGRAVGC